MRVSGAALAVDGMDDGARGLAPPTGGGAAESRALRREAGGWLKRLREAAGLTQADVAQRLGLRYYTFVSQVEGGHGRVPSDQAAAWADALGVARRPFARELLRCYDPDLHKLLFAGDPRDEAGADPEAVLAAAASGRPGPATRTRRAMERLRG